MKGLIEKTITLSLVIAIFTACAGSKSAIVNPEAEATEKVSQQMVDAVLWYNYSAENYYMYKQLYNFATERLVRFSDLHNGDRPLAVVMDLDETVLNNSAYSIQLINNKHTYSQETWQNHEKSLEATALPGSIAFINRCNEMGIKVFYISNRQQELASFTLNNMKEIGILDVEMNQLIFKEDDSDKTARRDFVSQNYEVILYLGDNLRDISEEYSQRSNNYGKDRVDQRFDEDSEHFILFPNPIYGEWEKPILKGAETNEEKLQLKKEHLAQ